MLMSYEFYGWLFVLMCLNFLSSERIDDLNTDYILNIHVITRLSNFNCIKTRPEFKHEPSTQPQTTVEGISSGVLKQCRDYSAVFILIFLNIDFNKIYWFDDIMPL